MNIKLKIKYVFCVVAGLWSVAVFGQDQGDKINFTYYGISIRADGTVPNPIRNKAFRMSFIGVYELSSSVDFNLVKGLFIGPSYQNAILKVSANKIAGLNTQMEIDNFGGKLGYDIPLSSKVFMTLSMNVGKNWSKFTSVICTDSADFGPHKFQSTYIEPEIMFNFYTEDNFAVGFNIAYTVINQNFDPAIACLNEYKVYTTKDKRGQIANLRFGFGCYFGFRKQK